MIRIFTAAGYKIGLGHLTRMRSLKDQLNKDGYECRLIIQVDDGLDCGLQQERYEKSKSWINNIDAMKSEEIEDDIVIIDTYETTADFMRDVALACKRLVAIDDYNRIAYQNCIVINPNVYGSFIEYPISHNCEYYLGSECLLLRPEFYAATEKKAIRDRVERILITFGGTDVLGLTHKTVCHCHEAIPEASLDVVVTSNFADMDAIANALKGSDKLYVNASAKQMRELMCNDDFAIASAGSTSNELFKTKCPSILIKVADNQSLTINYLEPLGYFKTFDCDSFERISEMLDPGVRASIYNKLMQLDSDSSAKNVIEQIYDNVTTPQGN